MEGALLPTRHYFEKFADSVRVYINETPVPQFEIQDAVKIEILDALRSEGIDMRDKSVTVPLIRKIYD